MFTTVIDHLSIEQHSVRTLIVLVLKVKRSLILARYTMYCRWSIVQSPWSILHFIMQHTWETSLDCRQVSLAPELFYYKALLL